MSGKTRTDRIAALPPHVVNQIAAGEVIERPASVVKELMENAIDAGARRIDVTVDRGGSERVRVVDDGHGLAADELPLALASHATSKIQTADDLFSITTLGFRGEALASIAAVSHLSIQSRPRTSEAGARLEVRGGEASEVQPIGGPPGTTIEVENLFFNTPVRRKFLRTVQTEWSHATEAFIRIALAHPGVHFTLKHNERLIHELPATDQWRARIARFFGDDLADDLLEVDSAAGEVRLSGYAADPRHSRPHTRMQYLFLNGRHIRDRALHHALGEAYRGLLLHGRSPICFLQLSMPPDEVDVNVHPTKLEVRFRDGSGLYRQLLAALRNRFLASDLTARLQPPPEVGTTNASDPHAAAPAEVPATRRFDAPPHRDAHGQRSPYRPHAAAGPSASASANSAADAAPSTPHLVRELHERPRGMQVHNRYLIAESDEGVVVIDQHALHERVLYERLRARILAGPLEAQRLLVPEPVDLAPAEAAAVLEHRDLLAELGLEVEPFGGDTLLVHSRPSLLARRPTGELLREVADTLQSGDRAPERRDLVDSVLQMMSCKAAVKAGDPLSPEEVDDLLAERHLAQDAHHCPHGRPTALVFTRDELDRQFKRT